MFSHHRYLIQSALTLVAVLAFVGSAAASAGTQENIAVETSAGPFAALLSSHFENDWSINLGIKTWLNKWETSIANIAGYNDITGEPIVNNDAPGFVMSKTGESETAFIPSFNIRFKNFLLAGSYYLPTTHHFSNATYAFSNITADPDNPSGQSSYSGFIRDTISAEREEFDITLGYYFNRYFTLLAGYKEISQTYSMRLDYYDSFGDHQQYLSQESANIISGPILGVAVSAPLGGNFSFFGTYAHSFLQFEADYGSSGTEECSYDLLEAGLSYTYLPKTIDRLLGITGYLGYRSQIIKADFSKTLYSDQKGPDVTDGFTLGLLLSF